MSSNNGQTAKGSLTYFLIPILLFLLCGKSISPIFAQKGRPLVLEFPLTIYGSNIQYIACDTLGLCVYYTITKEDICEFHLLHYDRNLQQSDHIKQTYPAEISIEAACYGDEEAVFILQNKIKKKKSSSGIILRYNCRHQKADTLTVDGLPAGDISQMKSTQELTIYSALSSNEKKSNLYYLARGSRRAEALQIPDATDYLVEDFAIDTIYRHIFVGLKSTLNNQAVIWLCETDYQSKPLFTSFLPDTLSYRCESLRMTQLDTGRWFLAGTYASRNQDITMGVYTLPFFETDNRSPRFDSLRFHPYSAVSVVAPNNSHYFHTNGRIVQDSSHVAFITETLTPEYHDRPVYNYGIMTYEYTFYGYRYSSADVYVFNHDGTERWYYNFAYDNILSQKISSYLNISLRPDQYLLYYTRGNSMVTMLTNAQDEILDSKETSNLFPQSTYSTYDYDGTRLKEWYGGYYLLSGYKRSTKSSQGGSTFFIHKLWYR
ncbi:MAG: hypothetical protein K6A41_04055 [Bacteroidales bacterium]|nr:hypothetical protein [Bacteroidales bacterium]